jgi:hypothetical protein
MAAVFRIITMTLASVLLLFLAAYLAAVLALGAFVVLSVMTVTRRFRGSRTPDFAWRSQWIYS